MKVRIRLMKKDGGFRSESNTRLKYGKRSKEERNVFGFFVRLKCKANNDGSCGERRRTIELKVKSKNEIKRYVGCTKIKVFFVLRKKVAKKRKSKVKRLDGFVRVRVYWFAGKEFGKFVHGNGCWRGGLLSIWLRIRTSVYKPKWTYTSGYVGMRKALCFKKSGLQSSWNGGRLH